MDTEDLALRSDDNRRRNQDMKGSPAFLEAKSGEVASGNSEKGALEIECDK